MLVGGVVVENDQGAAGHAAKQCANDVADPLAARLGVLGAGAVGEVVEDVLGEEGLHQAHQRDRQCRGQDQPQGLQVEWHLGQAQLRQAFREGAEAGHRGDLEPQLNGESGGDQDGHQGRGYGGGEPRQQIDDRQGERHQAPHHWQLTSDQRHLLGMKHIQAQLRQLRQEDEDCQRIHEARHHWLGHEAHLVSQAQVTPGDLKQARENSGGKQILKAQALAEGIALLHQTCHQQGGGSSGGGDHRAAATHYRQRHREQEGTEQAHPRIHTGDAGEGNRLGDHREGHHQAREEVAMGAGAPPRLEENSQVFSPVIRSSV